MIRADRRPNVATPVSRYRGTVGAPVDGHVRYNASPSMAVRPTAQEGCQLVNHFEFAKGASAVVSVLRLLAQLRLEVNKWYEAFFNSDSKNSNNLTEQDVTKRLTSLYSDLEKLVKAVDMRRPDSVPLRVLSTIYDEAAGLPASNSPVDEESYRECVEAAAVYQEFAQAYFDSTQRQEVARALRNMSHLGPDRLRTVPVEKMHAQFLAVLRALKANEHRLIDMHKWRVSAVIEMPFLETLIEVEFGRLRDERFVAQLKAALLIRQGELVSVSLGSPRETLWAKDDDVSSRYEVFRKMSSLASYRLFSTYSHTKMQNFQTVSMVFGFLQLYTLSFSLPCCGCHKVMRDYLPPMVLTDFNQFRPSFFHENCLV